MRTEKQIQASRANGAKSRGPVTPAGKWNASHSSFRHKLVARSIALQTEDPRQLRDLLSDLCTEFQPGTAFEHSVVESIATARWEQQRLRCARKVAVDLQIQKESADLPAYPHAGAAATSNALCSLFAASRALDCFHREDARLERQIQRAVETLFYVQQRRGFQPDPLSPAGSGPELAPPTPEPCAEPGPASSDPATDPDSAVLAGFLPSETFCAVDPNKRLKTHDDVPSPIPAARVIECAFRAAAPIASLVPSRPPVTGEKEVLADPAEPVACPARPTPCNAHNSKTRAA